MQTMKNASRRAGLTLLELVVVVLILAVLAALVVPRLSGVVTQSNSAANAAVVDEVNRAVQMFETRNNGKHAFGWDSLMNTDGTLFSRLHPNVTQTADQTLPSLQVVDLTDLQVASLKDAGIIGLHDAVETRTDGTPSDNSSAWHSITSGAKAVTLRKPPVTTGHGSTFIDKAFSIDQFKSGGWDKEYVVVGLGGPTSLKGVTLTEIPLIQSATPSQYYARVMCVFKVPGTGTTATGFTAQYVGCFMPDGSSLRSNVEAYGKANVAAN